MAMIRRHWQKIIWIHALVILLIGGVLYYLNDPPAKAQTNGEAARPAPAALIGDDVGLYTDLVALRRELALTDRDLAALGQSPDGAGAVLQTLVTWLQNNRNALKSADAAVQLATRSLQDAARRINVGPKDDGVIASLPTLQTNHETALAARQQVLAGAVTAVNAHLTGDQQTVWTAARTNANLPDAVRYVSNLSADQIQLLKQPSRSGSREEILSVSQRAQTAAASVDINAGLSAIADRTALLLPLPVQLRTVAATGPALPTVAPTSQPIP
jgi:hypothetical protein